MTLHAPRRTGRHSPPTVFFAPVCSDDLSERLYPLLSESERQQADRFKFAVDRAAYCTAHYLLRACLTLIAGPEAWRFERADDGKPYLHPDCAKSGLQFNLTHSRTQVACAFAFGRPIGVDTEEDYAAPDLLEVAALVCSKAEVDLLSKLEGQARRWAFARLWTAKEALAKASGQGLGLDLKAFPIDWERKTFSGTGRELGHPLGWTIEHRLAGGSHLAAVVQDRSRTAQAIAFDWNPVRLGDLAAGSDPIGWDIAHLVDSDKPCQNAAVA